MPGHSYLELYHFDLLIIKDCAQGESKINNIFSSNGENDAYKIHAIMDEFEKCLLDPDYVVEKVI